MSSQHTCMYKCHLFGQINISVCLSTAQTDLGLRYRTFSQKIISRLHFLKSLKRGNVKRLCLYGQMSSHIEFQLQIMF